MRQGRHLYFTFGESYSGIFRSQVIDVVRHMNHELNVDVALFSILPMRLWSRQQSIIRKDLKRATVWSALPFQGRFFLWRWHAVFLGLYVLLSGRRYLICRGALATKMALDLKRVGIVKSVVYDGRGAMAAEHEEYQIYQPKIGVQVENLERTAVIDSDHRIAVTDALADYWRDRFDFSGQYSKIPCTLSSSWKRSDEVWNAGRLRAREKLGVSVNDIVLLYSGSSAGWQSFDLLLSELERALNSSPRIQVLLMCPETLEIEAFIARWPDRIRRMFVAPSEVLNWISSADVGMILREGTVTNSVAMPTKFAEYLAAGLHLVLTAPSPAADYVLDNQVGTVWESGFDWTQWLENFLIAQRKSELDVLGIRERSRKCAYRDFLKTSKGNRKGYEEVLGYF